MMPSSDPRNYARFIPKEELGDVSQWRFGAVGSSYSPDELDERCKQAEQTRQQLLLAQDDAYVRGMAEGRKLAQQEAERLCHAYIEEQGQAAALHTAQCLANVVAVVQRGLEHAEAQMAQGVLDLACTLARQVLRYELTIDPLAVRHVVSEAMRLLTVDGKVATLRLNPQDLALLQVPLSQQFADGAMNFIADSAVLMGDCTVECAGAVIDGSLERRWARAVSGLGLMTPTLWDCPADDGIRVVDPVEGGDAVTATEVFDVE